MSELSTMISVLLFTHLGPFLLNDTNTTNTLKSHTNYLKSASPNKLY